MTCDEILTDPARILTPGGEPILDGSALRLVARFRQRSGERDARVCYHDLVQWLDCRLPDGEPERFAQHLEERGYARAPGSFRAVVGSNGVARVVHMDLAPGQYDWCDLRIESGARARFYRRVAYRGFVVLFDPRRRGSEF